jgi:hypothetical protein
MAEVTTRTSERDGTIAPGAAVRSTLAALSGAAGAIHLVMVPSHWDESVVEGIGFALAGWLQLTFAWIVLVRPRRDLVAAGVVGNLALIAAWVWSRTAGLPFGAHAGHAEEAGFVDVTAVGLEIALVLGCAALLARPALGRDWSMPATRLGVLTPVVAVVLATAAIASPSARDHAATSHGDHAAATTDVAASAADGHDHGRDEATDVPTSAVAAPATASGDGEHDDHGTAQPAVDDRGLSLLGNGHHAEIGLEQPLSREERAELSRQIELTQQVAKMYPTIADAEAAGYRRAGPYSPGLGIHYTRTSGEGLNPDGVMDDADLLSPLAIIYAGTDPDAPIAGFMYYSMSAEEPEGFAGPNDIWHYHTSICIKPAADGIDAPFGADVEVPDGLCEQAGGTMLQQTQWMVHVWSVPGWESQQGLFGEVNPALTCSDGTYYILPIEEWLDHPLNVCRSDAA